MLGQTAPILQRLNLEAPQLLAMAGLAIEASGEHGWLLGVRLLGTLSPAISSTTWSEVNASDRGLGDASPD